MPDAGGLPPQNAADIGRAGEGDLVHIGVLDQHRTGLAAAGDDVDHAGRQSGFGHDLGEEQRAQAGVGGGLEHDRVAHRNGRRDLPGQHQQREVPGDDLPDHADRLVVAQFGLHQLRPTGVIVEVTGQQRHVDVARFADRLAVVHRLEHGQQAVVLLDVAGDGVQIAGADDAGRLAPAFEGGAGGSHGGIDFRLACLGGLRQQSRHWTGRGWDRFWCPWE